MKPKIKKGILQETLYMIAIIAIITGLVGVGMIKEEKAWLYICFFVLAVAPLRKGYLLDFKLFTWRNWERYLLHTIIIAAIIIVIEQIIY